jgi:DNA repair exonuclease SbcCD ATPase subunit
MNATLELKPEPEIADERTVLARAIEHRTHARELLNFVTEAVGRSQALADGADAEVRRLESVVETQKAQRAKGLLQRIFEGFSDGGAAPIDDQATRLERIAAQDQADIAHAALEQLRTQLEAAQAELQKADAAVKAAARALLRAQIRADFEQYVADLQSLKKRFHRFLGLRIAEAEVWCTPSSLTDREWDSIDFNIRNVPNAEQLNIGLPILALSELEAFGGRTLADRASVDEMAVDWQQRLDALIARAE